MSINAASMNPIQRVMHSTITRIGDLPKSHPKTMQALEPTICALFRFSHHHPRLFSNLVTTAIAITAIAQGLLLATCVVITFPMTNITILSATLLIGTYLMAYMIFMGLLCDIAPSRLGEKQLDQALDITKMTAALFNLDPEFVSRLNTWTNETSQLNENWPAVRKTIIQFYNSNHSRYQELSLSGYQLHSLPDIFDIPVFRNKLQVLNLSDNQLTTLPASIGSLQSLEYLDLSKNATLSSLPEEVRHLPSRYTVDINNCSFSQASLEILRETMGQSILPVKCTTVAIYNSDFSTAYRFRRASSLTRDVYAIFENYTRKAREIIETMKTRKLEEKERQTRILERLEEKRKIQRERDIEKEKDIIRNHVRTTSTSASLTPELQDELAVPSLEDSLSKLYTINGTKYKELSNLKEMANLDEWLNGLYRIVDYNKDLSQKKSATKMITDYCYKDSPQQKFVTKIIEYLEKANENASFREMFRITISNTLDYRDYLDSVALSVVKLGVAYKLSTIDPKDMQSLNHLLTRGVWAPKLLQKITSKNQFINKIAIYFGYLIKLKQELNLPIDTENMLYFDCNALTPKDLESAQQTVLSSINNENRHVTFLIKQPQWIETLKLNYEEQFRAIEETKANALDVDNFNYKKIERIYKQDLKELTKQALSS